MDIVQATRLFDNLASNYQKYRPSYPETIVSQLKRYAEPLPRALGSPVLLDVGSGTGILLRRLKNIFGPDFQYLGIEPSAGMIQRAQDENRSDLYSGIEFIQSSAEEVPLPDASVSVITIGQTLHWLDRSRFYGQVERLLSSNGTFAVVYNDRDVSDPLMASYEWFVGAHNKSRESDVGKGSDRAGLGIVLLRSGVFRSEIAALPFIRESIELRQAWQRSMLVDEFVRMCLSTVQMQNVIAALGEQVSLSRLYEIVDAYSDGAGAITVPYLTSMICAKRT